MKRVAWHSEGVFVRAQGPSCQLNNRRLQSDWVQAKCRRGLGSRGLSLCLSVHVYIRLFVSSVSFETFSVYCRLILWS